MFQLTQLTPKLGNYFKTTFMSRSNRFIVMCKKPSGETIRTYLPNPGRLHELFLPGVTLYVRPAEQEPGKPPRKTAFTTIAVERDGLPIFLHTHETNDIVQLLLKKQAIPALKGARIIKREVKVGRSRFDFLLKHKKKDLYLEVKSCTLFGQQVAMFPDAITERGRRHLLELAEMSKEGINTAVIFAIQSPRLKWFMPDFHTDLAFSKTLLEVRNHVTILPIAIPWTEEMTIKIPVMELTIPWDYLETEVVDRGSYILLLELKRKKSVEVGSLGKLSFSKGHYLYVGSAMANLSARIARHKRKDGKKFHWHIDFLRQVADDCIALPIRSSRREECEVSAALQNLYPSNFAGFGSTDCTCQSHLFYSPELPLHQREFHDFLEHFRMKSPNEERTNVL